MSCVGVVGLVVGFGIVVVVQQNSAAGDAMDCPMMDAAAVICGVTYEVGAFGLYGLVLRNRN